MRVARMCCLVFSLLCMSPLAQADWFVSSQVKDLKVKAEAGDAEAAFRVGAAYDFGHGAPHDGAEAFKWYRMAADAGFAEAQNSLGSGMQAEKRYDEARGWYERAAAQHHPQATNNLAYLYDLGLGVPQDRHKGFELYSLAAELGWAEAMWNLANMYGGGQIGPEDMFMACVWAFRAERYARPSERQLLLFLHKAEPQIELHLTAEHRQDCYKQAADWHPSGPPAAPATAASGSASAAAQ